MKRSILSGILLSSVFFFISVGRTRSCQVFNTSVEQILENSPHLHSIYNELGPQGFLSGDGLRTLLTKLMLRTTCSQSTKEFEKLIDHDKLDHSHTHEKEHLDHEHRHHVEERVDSNLDDNFDSHDHLHHNEDEHNHHHDHEHDHNHDHHNHSSEIPHDHRALIDTPRFSSKVKENMIDLKNEKEGSGMEISNSGHNHETEEEFTHEVVGKTKICDSIEKVVSIPKIQEDGSLLPEEFLHLCPAILNVILNPSCHVSSAEEGDHHGGDDDHHHSHHQVPHRGYDRKDHVHHHRHQTGDSNQMTKDSWLAAILSLILIGLTAFCCIMVIPILKRSKYYVLINHFLLALAVGSLAGDALIHLLPHAMTMEIKMSLNGHLVHALYGFTTFLGIICFLLLERAHDLFGGQKHSHGHSHDPEGEDFIKEIGIISAELNETSAQRFDKIGEKLSQHSKHNSFVYAEATSPSDTPRGCFESCPPNLGSGPDSNGNNGTIEPKICKPRVVDHTLASVAECERLVNSQTQEKNDHMNSSKTPLAPIPPPPLVQSSPPKSLIRQDSNNFNMVLQEYHVGHHGHSHHGHSHVTGKKDSLRTMILLGDGIHSFMDGMAIGAAFGTSLTGGIATAVAVLCHELPHKVGDFAILFEMGMKRIQAVKMMLVLWILSLIGLAIGVSIGSIQAVSPWIYCYTAGVFLYLALVDLLAELSINDTETCKGANQMALQIGGMLTGSLIMLIIAIYEHDLEDLLEGAF